MINDKVSESAETTEIDSEVNTEAWLELLKKKKRHVAHPAKNWCVGEALPETTPL